MDNSRRNLMVLIGVLLALGLVMVYSASFVTAEKRFGSPTFFLERHCIYLLAGCMAFAVAAMMDYHCLARQWRWLLLFSLGLLVLVLLPGLGERINGAQRWFRFGPLTLQPSEVAKPLLIVGLAGWAVSRKDRIGTFRAGFLPGALLAGAAVGLVALEPDLGTAALLSAVLGSILLVAGVRLTHAVPAVLMAVPLVAVCAWSRLAYIQARINEFLSAEPDALGRGYQVTQALIAQGSGGVTGVGIGQGNAKLLFLPEAHNDFIFALVGEELGMVGALCVVGCFALLIWQGWRIAQRAPDVLGHLIALGVTLLVGLQAAMNIAVVTRSMPTKGISLPLVSYGGSSLVFTLFALGLLMNVAVHRHAKCEPPRAPGAPRESGEPPRTPRAPRELSEPLRTPRTPRELSEPPRAPSTPRGPTRISGMPADATGTGGTVTASV